MALAVAGTLAVSAGAAQAQLITGDASATHLASAMQATGQAGLVTGASWPALPGGAANPSLPDAVGVGNTYAGLFMPDDGSSFAALTSGDVDVADPPNNSSSAGRDNGTASRNVNDLSILKVDVNVPASDNCLSVDGVFYSEEYPEYVGSSFNDGFIAELDTDDWTYNTTNNTVTAPHNFAFDENNHQLTVNSVSFASSGQDTGLQYDGSTKALSASTAVTPGAHSLYFSIYDAGDHVFDSAMLLDNLRTFHAAAGQCQAGATIADKDGDGIPDDWEINGIRDHDGNMLLNLPAMGADPNHKDVFVQLDAMKGLALDPKALGLVTKAFNDAPVSNPDGTTGIHMHIDAGPNSVMNPVTGATWGGLSDANESLPFQTFFGVGGSSNYQWGAFDSLEQSIAHPDSAARQAVFHRALSVNRYGAPGNTSSGIARGIPSSDFIVALGSACNPMGTCPGSISQQAGTFMHELGHNLGLHHGGQVDENHVPNYLSIMNYTFQMEGLSTAPDLVDYSRYDSSAIPTLDENNLNETSGFGVLLPLAAAGQTTLFWCDNLTTWNSATLAGPVDFNCNGSTSETGISANLHGANQQPASFTGKGALTSYNDWANLKYRGGAIGGNSLGDLLPATTEDDEPPLSELQATADKLVPPPSGTTESATAITASGAVLHGTATPNGNAATASFQYGTTTDYGSKTNPVGVGSGNSGVATTAPVAGLAPSTAYHYQQVVETDGHIVYGADKTFTTAAGTKPPGNNATSKKRCVVPTLKGKTAATAKKRLKSAHCKLGRTTVAKAARHHKRSKLVVISQSRRAKLKLANGTKVSIVLGLRAHKAARSPLPSTRSANRR